MKNSFKKPLDRFDTGTLSIFLTAMVQDCRYKQLATSQNRDVFLFSENLSLLTNTVFENNNQLINSGDRMKTKFITAIIAFAISGYQSNAHAGIVSTCGNNNPRWLYKKPGSTVFLLRDPLEDIKISDGKSCTLSVSHGHYGGIEMLCVVKDTTWKESKDYRTNESYSFKIYPTRSVTITNEGIKTRIRDHLSQREVVSNDAKYDTYCSISSPESPGASK